MGKDALSLSKPQLTFVIDRHTRESGVRTLDRLMAKLARKAALASAEGEDFSVDLSQETLESWLGTPRFDRDRYQGNEVAGVVTGLAWTPVGGDILFIETTIAPGAGKLNITGNLGGRHEGIRHHCHGLPQSECRDLRTISRTLHQVGCAHPRARRRHSQGRTFCLNRFAYSIDFAFHAAQSQKSLGLERRDNVAWQSAARGWDSRKDFGGETFGYH